MWERMAEMKKVVLFVLAGMFFCVNFTPAVFGTEVTGTLILQPGETQRYVPFPFTVPFDEGVKVFQYKSGSGFFKKDGVWQELPPLTDVPQYGGHQGFYRFINNTRDVFQINGTPHKAKTMASFLAISDVDDLGLFSSYSRLNDFGLPEKSNIWSYELLCNISGKTIYPEDIVKYHEDNFNAKLIAFLVASDDGVWARFYLYNDPALNYITFDDNDIVACIIYKGKEREKAEEEMSEKIVKLNRDIFGVTH